MLHFLYFLYLSYIREFYILLSMFSMLIIDIFCSIDTVRSRKEITATG
jgi:hypothetical protein